MTNQPLGFDAAGEGDVLLLVHGFPLDRTIWKDQVSGLSDIRRVVAVDLPGRGQSSDIPVDSITMDRFADHLAATLDSIDARAADVAGLSMGGYVAFAFLRRHRDRVRSLILASTKAGADNDEGRAGREKTAASVTEKGTLPALEETLLPKLLAPGAGEDVRSRLRAIVEAMPPATAAADSLAMRDRQDSTPDLASVDVPALVVHGQEDALMPVDGASQMATAIPGASFVAIPGAGHLAPMEKPQAVNDAVRDFLRGQQT